MNSTNQIDHQYEIAVAAFRNAFDSGIIHQDDPYMYSTVIATTTTLSTAKHGST